MSDNIKGLIKVIIFVAIMVIILIILVNLFNKKETPKATLNSGVKQINNLTTTDNTTSTDNTTDINTTNETYSATEVNAPDTAAADYLTPLLGLTVITIGSYSIYRYRKETN